MGLARAEAVRFSRADKMVIAKRWNCAGHVARIKTPNPMLHHLLGTRDLTWCRDNNIRWRSDRQLHRRPGIQRHWEQHFDDCWTKTGLEWKTVTTDGPQFDAGLKEVANIHEAQSRKVNDGDDTDLNMTAPTASGVCVKHRH